jgi:uncharacterized OsmC-like protein
MVFFAFFIVYCPVFFINFSNDLIRMTSKITYLGDLRTEMVHIQSGSAVLTDAPTDNHGKGLAFSPTDLMATALGSCMLTTMAIGTMSRGLTIDGASATVQKIMSSDPPRRIVRIEVRITMPSNNYTEEEKQILEKIAYACPISKSLHPDLEQAIEFVW